ncbi:hypothetical protein BDV93DRAFT_394476, partial [Ceratobasidium sp. AG-I]
VRHRPGVDNTVCDALSPTFKNRPEDTGAHGLDQTVDPGWELAKGLINNIYFLADDEGVADLLKQFKADPFFADILLSLLLDPADPTPLQEDTEVRIKKRRSHRAEGYVVDEGKLWLIGGKHTCAADRVECIPLSEVPTLALSVHSLGGHFRCDMTILMLQQRHFWPTMRRDATDAVLA